MQHLCPGVTYYVIVGFNPTQKRWGLGPGHHLLTSTYGTFDDVCLGSSNACKNRACPSELSNSSASHYLTMPCSVPGGWHWNESDNMGVFNTFRVSWGDGLKVDSFALKYWFGGTVCKPCVAPSPNPTPSPSSPLPTRLSIKVKNTTFPLTYGPLDMVGTTLVVVRLVGYSSDSATILGSFTVLKVRTNGVVPPVVPLVCAPAPTRLTKQANGDYLFVTKCTATGVGRARLNVTLTDPPGLSRVSALVEVTAPE